MRIWRNCVLLGSRVFAINRFSALFFSLVRVRCDLRCLPFASLSKTNTHTIVDQITKCETISIQFFFFFAHFIRLRSVLFIISHFYFLISIRLFFFIWFAHPVVVVDDVVCLVWRLCLFNGRAHSVCSARLLYTNRIFVSFSTFGRTVHTSVPMWMTFDTSEFEICSDFIKHAIKPGENAVLHRCIGKSIILAMKSDCSVHRTRIDLK